MKIAKRFLACACMAAMLLALSACAVTPLSEYNKAAKKTMEETSYRETITMKATATVDYSVIQVSIYSNLDCTGNTASTFKASGEGAAVVGADYLEEDMVTPYKIYIRDNYYYYDYPNYYEDGSSYQHKFSAEFGTDDPICDLLAFTLSDIDSAEVTETQDGRTVITMHIKNDAAEEQMLMVTEPMDVMLFGADTISITLRDMTVTTTLDEQGRVAQSTATVTGTGSYYGSYISIVYVYDLTYTDYGAEITPTFPEGIENFPTLE